MCNITFRPGIGSGKDTTIQIVRRFEKFPKLDYMSVEHNSLVEGQVVQRSSFIIFLGRVRYGDLPGMERKRYERAGFAIS